MEEAVDYSQGDQSEEEEIPDVYDFADGGEAVEGVRLRGGGEEEGETAGRHGEGVPCPCKVLEACER